MLKEVYRVLRDDGELIIKETYSPPYQDELESLFAESGFKISIILVTDEEFPELFKKYNLEESPSQYAYFLRAKK